MNAPSWVSRGGSAQGVLLSQTCAHKHALLCVFGLPARAAAEAVEVQL